MKWRFFAIQSAFVFLALLILARLMYWQVITADSLRSQADLQRLISLEIPARRGDILASDGFPLAANRANYLLFADPSAVGGATSAAQLRPFLPASDAARLDTKLAQSDLRWVALSSQISPEIKQKIDSLSLPGLGWQPQPQRLYPEASISAHLLGFVGKNASGQPVGYFGLEGFYERKLSGQPGRLVQERDALNRPIIIGTQNLWPSQDGESLATFIDRPLQYVVYYQLQAGLARYGASSGTVTIMRPTGEIVALVGLPGYDAADYSGYSPEVYRNPVVADSFEPGSVFKTVVMAAALDSKVVKPDTVCDICAGPVQIPDYVIRTWNEKYYSQSTVAEILQHSDNVGMVFVSRKLGKARLLDYLKRFGFGQLTGVDFQEESSPLLRPDNKWTEVDLATAAFGQGIAVTPLQMLRAVAVLANRGNLTTPRVAQSAESATRRVISPSTTAQMTQMMVESVNKGEAKWAKPAGWSIAGKTGTAQIPVAGHYDAEKTIASFVGFAPAENPQFVMLVTLREPQTSPWGSETAAPLWFDIAREIFRLWKIPPS